MVWFLRITQQVNQAKVHKVWPSKPKCDSKWTRNTASTLLGEQKADAPIGLPVASVLAWGRGDERLIGAKSTEAFSACLRRRVIAATVGHGAD